MVHGTFTRGNGNDDDDCNFQVKPSYLATFSYEYLKTM